MPARSRVFLGLGVGLIWAFLILFLVYPLCRVFYDAVTNEAGQLTLANFGEFFTHHFYLRSLWNSLILGLVTVITSSILGVAIAFLLVRFDFSFLYSGMAVALCIAVGVPIAWLLGRSTIPGRGTLAGKGSWSAACLPS